MAFSLMARDEKIFDLFDQAADIVDRYSDRFLQLVSDFERLSERSTEIRRDRSRCEDVSRRTVHAAETSFVTPFDREDIHELIQAINEWVLEIAESAGRFETFRLEKPTDGSLNLTRLLRRRCHHVVEALRFCRHWKNIAGIRGHFHDVNPLEGEVNRARRDFFAALSASPHDVLGLIKWCELYNSPGDAVSSFRRVAQPISAIVVQGT